MKSGNQDKTEGKLREIKGKIKEEVGDLTGNRQREAEGKVDKNAGKAQGKRGEIKKAFEK